MTKTLDVYLHRELVGHLIQNNHGKMAFTYADDWLAIAPPHATLSHAMPPRKEPYNDQQCHAFFGGILPDANIRAIIAKNLGISARNDFSMLEKIGGDCAGAVVLMAHGTPLPSAPTMGGEALTDTALAALLKELPQRPLLAGNQDIRLSLAGAQDKVAVCIRDNKIYLPTNGAPSTHILKPEVNAFPGLVFNEAFCMSLAGTIGLPVSAVAVARALDVDYLIVTRYDRATRRADAASDDMIRLHQEDFCQALGIPPELKYQNENGPSLAQCFALLRAISAVPVRDIQHFLDAAIFNFLIGNHDAHGKNFSILYDGQSWPVDGNPRLAPLYDLICTAHYPNLSPKMAMRIGSQYAFDDVYPKHFATLADESGLSKPFVKQRVTAMAENILANLDKTAINHPIAATIGKLIAHRCHQVLQKFTTDTTHKI